MKTNARMIEQIVDVCHRLYAKGFVTATDGNVSVRLENGNFLTTRTSINKGMVTAEDLVEVDSRSNPIAKSAIRNPRPSQQVGTVGRAQSSIQFQPSTELGMHLFIYSLRPDVNAVVHAHPPYATGFATARQPLTECLFPEVIVGLGAVPLAEYATPSTDEVAQSLAPFVRTSDAILLANHGVVTYGKDMYDAFFKMEKVEHAAHITFVARILGGEKPLSTEDVEKLRAISQTAYGKDFSSKTACQPEDELHRQAPTDEEIRELVRQMIQKT